MPEPPDCFYVIPHTHWEGAVFQTREEYLALGLPHLLQALRLLKLYPQYRFALDQACYVRPFLERYPQEQAALSAFVAEGRLALVGGTQVMLDVNMPGGESFVRQVLYGKGFFRRRLGAEVTVGWALDTFGHHAQMPQLMRLAGFNSYWFMRGVSDWSVPAEFLWEGLDGSRIPAFWLAHTYGLLYGSPPAGPPFADFVQARYELLTPFAAGHERVGLAGADVSRPEEHVPLLVEQYNQQPDRPFRLQLALPADYEAAVARRPERPVVTGELNPIFPGTYSSRIELKQRLRQLETLLTDAEKLGALLRVLGAERDPAVLEQAWEPVLFNQAHDLMSGVMTDHVYEDTIRGHDFAQRLGEEELHAALQELVARLDTSGGGQPLVVLNTLGWTRTDLVVATLGFSTPGVSAVSVIGPDGEVLPSQILESERHPDGSLLQARVAFLARDVPALGYAVYHVVPSAAAEPTPAACPDPVLENDFYRLELDAATGALAALTVKEGDWPALSGPGNVVAMEPDHGDLWELYRPLDGASRIAMTERHGPPAPGQATLSTDRGDGPGRLRCGPVLSEYTVGHPFGTGGRFQTTVRLYAGLRRIEIRTSILNHDEAVRYRVLFPTSIRDGESVHEIPFGALPRPQGLEFPAQNWVDYSDRDHGVALLNRGLPGNNLADGTLMLSLLRSTRIVSYGYSGGYEPGMSSDTGLELGQELTFDYALVPHAGDWRAARLYREGQAFNHPLLVIPAASHAGALPPRWRLLEVSPENVVVSALKLGSEGQVVLRVYEAAGTPVPDAAFTFTAPLLSAVELNLMEDPLQTLAHTPDSLPFSLRAFEVKTFGLTFAAPD